MLLRLQACVPPAPLPTSITPRLHVCSPRPKVWRELYSTPPHLHCASERSRAPSLHVATPTSSLQTSSPQTSPSLHLQRASNPPDLLPPYFDIFIPTVHLRQRIPPRRNGSSAVTELYTYMLSRLHDCSAPPSLRPSVCPYVHTSTSPRLQRASGASELHTSIPPRPHAYRTPPAFHTSVPSRLHACSAPPELHASIPTRRHARGPPPDLSITHTSVALPTARLKASDLHVATLLHLHRAPRALKLYTSMLHKPISGLQSSRSPFLHTSIPSLPSRALELHAPSSARLQFAFGDPYLYISMSTHLKRASRIQCLHVQHACSASP